MADETPPPPQLDIDFLDPIDDVEIGRVFRFQVLQKNAKGESFPVSIENLEFNFSPITWGTIVPTEDNGIGALHVVQVVESEDVFLEPHYSVHARHRAPATRTLAPRRKVRMGVVSCEIELGFAIGLEGKWKAFQPLALPRPVDFSTARLSDGTHKLLVREGKVFLRVEHLDSLPAEVALTFPSGEKAALRIEGFLKGIPVDQDERARITRIGAPQAEPVPEDPETQAVRGELHELRGYIASFGGAGKRRPDDANTIENIRRRIGLRVSKTKERLMGYRGPAQDELLSLFKAATDLIPLYLRDGPPLTEAAAGGADGSSTSSPKP
ncbi:hypothetical protein HY251_21960 [bacterium]|nr:hypothetical protein [bacterium]